MPTDADVVLTVSVTVDDRAIRQESRHIVGADARSRLRRKAEAMLPDGYTIDDFEGEYRTYRAQRFPGLTTYELRVFL